MSRTKISAGAAAFAVSLVSVLAPVEANLAQAQETASQVSVEHTQTAAVESSPRFITRQVVQSLPTDSAEERAIPSASSLNQLVARMAPDAQLDDQLQCLAGAIFFEARGEPLAGQLAVAEVIINRAASGRFPTSYCGVVKQKSQFSFVKGGRMPAIPTGAATWQRAKAIAQIAHRDMWQSQADGALFFHARSVSPGWSGKRQSARIANHVFYR